MNAPTLLEDLRRAGVALADNGGRLAFDAPAGTMTADRMGALKAHKAELLAILAGDWQAAADALLATVADPQAREDLAERYRERLAIVTIDGNLPEAEAARIGYAELAQTPIAGGGR